MQSTGLVGVMYLIPFFFTVIFDIAENNPFCEIKLIEK